jgi:hypothetical protein
LPNKTEVTYQRLLSELTALPQGAEFQPQSVMTDFELAAKNAVSEAFPGVVLRGCFFHLSQCCWRKIQDLGLAEAYKQDDEFALSCRMLPALAFVPPDEVRAVFMAIARDYPPELDDFLIYFERNFIGTTVAGRPRAPIHPVEEWNQYQATFDNLPRPSYQQFGGGVAQGISSEFIYVFLSVSVTGLQSPF